MWGETIPDSDCGLERNLGVPLPSQESAGHMAQSTELAEIQCPLSCVQELMTH